jgi:ketosteroid isomerase-like protein
MRQGTFWRPANEEVWMRGTWWVAALAAACAAPKIPTGDPAREIPAMLARSAADWNRGDLDGFMGDYVRDSTVGYVSGGHVQYGWQPLYDHYKATYFAPGQSRDSLSFVEIAVRPLTMDLAYATARFELHRGDSLVASGPFTLILQKRGDRWQILHDHTSADPKP